MTMDNLVMEVEKTVYKGVPFVYRAKRDRYYDLSASTAIDGDTTLEVNLEPYSGLGTTCTFYQGNAPFVTIENGQLPDYTMYNGTSGCLNGAGRYYLVDEDGVASIHSGLLDENTAAAVPAETEEAVVYNVFFNKTDTLISSVSSKTGYRWIGTVTVPAHEATQWVRPHFEIEGNATITNNVASFNGGILAASCPFPEHLFFPVEFEFTTKVVAKVGAETQYQTLWKAIGQECSIGLFGSAWAVVVGNSTSYAASVEDETAYWVRVVENSSSFTILYYMVDDGTYTLETLPDVSDSAWQSGTSAAMTATQNLFKGQTFSFSDTGTAQRWLGTVDVANTLIRTKSLGSAEEGSWQKFWQPLEPLTA